MPTTPLAAPVAVNGRSANSSAVARLKAAASSGVAEQAHIEAAVTEWKAERERLGIHDEMDFDPSEFKPFPAQQPIIDAILSGDWRFVVVSGAFGSAKTIALTYAFAQHTMKHLMDGDPRLVGVCSHMKQMCDDTLQPLLYQWYEAELGRKVTSNAAGLQVGKVMHRFHPSEQAQAWTKLKGRGWSGAIDEEAELAEERFRRQVVTRCRVKHDGADAMVVLGANPTGTDTAWYKHWIAAQRRRQITFHMTLFDNLGYTEDYLREQWEGLDPNEDAFRQDVLGEYTSGVTHLIYKGRYEVVTPPLLDPYHRMLVVDYAPVGDNAALIYERHANHYVVTDEWRYNAARHPDKANTIPVIRDALREWVGNREIGGIIPDPSADIPYKQALYRTWPRARRPRYKGKRINDRIAGTRAAKSIAEHGIVKVSERCVNLRRQLDEARYDPAKVQIKEFVPLKVTGIDDHLVDCFRYGNYSIALDMGAKGVRWSSRGAG